MNNRYWMCYLASLMSLWGLGLAAQAGRLDSPAPPTSAANAMYSLADIYNRLNAGRPAMERMARWLGDESRLAELPVGALPGRWNRSRTQYDRHPPEPQLMTRG